MKATWLRHCLVVLALLAAETGGACTHTTTPPPQPPSGPAPAFVAGTYDCAAPATWKTTSFAGLVPAVERALANDNAGGALGGLLQSHYAEEVTCVAGYVHDQSVDQQATATDKDLPAKRVAATTTFIAAQSSKGLIVTNYGGEAH
jgi:hypothetical protein